MSQKRLKRIKRAEVLKTVDKPIESFLGIRGIIKENWKFLLVLCFGVFLLYFNSLNGDFVSDDYASIPQNPYIRDFGYMFGNGLIVGFTNWFLTAIFTFGNSIPFHLLNLIFYTMVCCLAFIFLVLLFPKGLSMVVAGLFAVHPIHVEAISWISGKPYIITSTFLITSLIALVLYAKTATKKYLILLIVSFLLAFFTDRVRSFAILPLSVLILMIFGENLGKKVSVGKFFAIGMLISVFLTILLYPLIASRVDSVNSGYNGSESVFYDPFFQYPTSVAKYLQLLVVPVDLTLYHTMYVFPAWLNWSILLVYFVCLVYFLIKNKYIFFALIFIFVATIPSMAPVKVSWLVAERYMFLGSLGFCLLVGIVLNDLQKKNRLVVAGVLGILMASGVIRTILRNVDWQTNHNLWVSTCQISPNSHNAWNNIGDDYDKLKYYDNAIKSFTQSVLVKPNYADAYHNRANIFFKIGRLDLARESYQTALNFNPAMFQTYLSLTQIDLMEKRFDLALMHANKVVELQSENPQVYYVLGVVYAQMGEKNKAVEIFKKILAIYPDYQPAKEAMLQLKQLD